MTRYLIKFSWIGPLIFFGAIVIFGFLHSGYSHISQFISELGAKEADYGQLMNYLGIVPFGLSILLFSIAGVAELKGNMLGRIAFLILAITGILFILAGVFSCDAGCDFENMTQEAIIHNMSAFSAFLLFLLAAILLGINTFTKKKNRFYLFSLISGILGMFFFYLISKAGIFSEYRGVYQRLFIANFLIWLITMGYFIHGTAFQNSNK